MNEKVLHVLEFDKIIERLQAHASSARGKQMSRELVPYDNMADIERAQTETADALERIFAKGSLSFAGIKDVRGSLHTAEAGGTLSTRELMDIAAVLETTDQVRRYGMRDEDSEKAADSLEDRFNCLSPLNNLASEIRHCILDEDNIADDASSELKSIRRQKGIVSEKVHGTLSSLINGSLKTYLMDNVITMRNNRYCVPVRAEYKSQVPGMVHDQSATGATLFIEPQSIVKLNNDIRELELQEKAEIQQILKNLSAMCGVNAEVIRANDAILTELDFIFAKAALALDMDAMKPVFNTNEIIRLKGARHPLIDKKKVVPIDIHLGDEFDLLIVTGPNTGGKTVSLKTVGLCELMGLSGLHIPAEDRSELSFFREIYADIGDEQSIEQSLSTFSSHMKNIVEILQHANITSLCLFDELGAGTDPTEGAALATAELDWLHKRSIRTIATTHYSELKEYALTTNWVENACCEFDVETLRPTYRILVGVPGKSNAFAISERLGLPDFIIKDAKERVNEEDEKFENLLASLEKNRVELEKRKAEIAKSEAEVAKLQEELDSGRQKLEASKEKILSKAKEEARALLSEAKATADETIKNMQKYADSDAVKAAERDRARLRDQLGKTKGKQQGLQSSDDAGIDPKKIKMGDEVKIVSMGLHGTVNSLPDSKGNLFVQCGIIKYKANASDLIFEKPKNDTKKTKVKSGQKSLSHAGTIKTECMLLGMTGFDAEQTLSHYLDEAYLSHLPQARIVHGKGSGVLRKVVHDFLKRCKYVESFRLGEFGEGDAGVTIVTFKQQKGKK
ncbi:DNA mismatch repair protein MutS2 [Lachnospiraceae bacterium KH1T2]|nr:DNA mismatch repair protein MutS2 [Lachnospiraceae bacterium KH1T2]